MILSRNTQSNQFSPFSFSFAKPRQARNCLSSAFGNIEIYQKFPFFDSLIMIIFMIMTTSTIVFGVTDYSLIYDIGTSARQIALGNVVGFSESSDSIFENPAGLYRVNQFSMSVFSTKVMGEVHYTLMAISSKLPIGRIGFGVMQATVDTIPKTIRYKYDPNNPDGVGLPDNDPTTSTHPQVENWFDYKNSIYKIAYQVSLGNRFELGTTYVYYRSEYYSISGTGQNFDMGIIYTHPIYETSLLVRNVLPNQEVRYTPTAYELLPTQYILSMKRSVKRGWDIFPQIKYQQNEWLASIGTKYTPNFLPFIHFVVGYKSFLTATQTRKTNASIGIGLTLATISIYYAYERSDYILDDHKNYISLTANF
jgi:hypothetical protein